MHNITKSYLFICGCPRSGTTVMRWILSRHPKIVIGSERFIHRAHTLEPELFDKERFFTQRPGDTFYDISRASDFTSMKEKYDDATWVGDKIPSLELTLDSLALSFPHSVVVAMLRNPIDVASSYETRFRSDDPSWSAGGASDAISDWNASISAIATASPDLQLIVVSYESTFVKGQLPRSLPDALGLDMRPIMSDFQGAVAKSQILESRRRRELDTFQVQQICEQADFATYRSVLESCRERA